MNNPNNLPFISDDDLTKINTIYQRGHTILRELRAVLLLIITLIVAIAALFGRQISIDNQLLNALSLAGGGGGASWLTLLALFAMLVALIIAVIVPISLLILSRRDRR